MRFAGYVLTAIGCLMVLGTLSNFARAHDLSSSHDLSKIAGGLGMSVLVLGGGLSLLKKTRGR